MKTQKTILTLIAAALTVWATGCKKEEASVTETVKEAASDAADATKKAAEAAKDSTVKAADAVADKTKELASQAAAAAKEVAAPVNTKAQELIDQATKLVSEGKFSEAMAKVKEASGEKLSATQQSVVDGLKAQIEKAMAASSKAVNDAATAAGNLLKK
jgi:hypothetical protein